MFLIQKYTQYKAAQAEQQKRKVTEKELAQLNHKIDKLLTKLDEHEPELANNQDEECVVCVHAKATMQTYPCGHRVVCRKCFVKTIQMAVAQRLLPLRCVMCRAKILRLKHTNGSGVHSSASQYTISGGQWYHVPQSASLYSVTSSTSGISGVSSASSCSSASSYKTCASSFSATSLKSKRSYSSYSKMGYQPLRTSSPSPSRSPQARSSIMAKKDNRVAPVLDSPVGNGQLPKGKLTLIREFQREYRHGKEQSANERKCASAHAGGSSYKPGSTRIKCARILVNQAQSSCSDIPTPTTETSSTAVGIGINGKLAGSSSGGGGGSTATESTDTMRRVDPQNRLSSTKNGKGGSGTGISRSTSMAAATSTGCKSKTGSYSAGTNTNNEKTPIAAAASSSSTNNNSYKQPPPSSQSCPSLRLSRRESNSSSSNGNISSNNNCSSKLSSVTNATKPSSSTAKPSQEKSSREILSASGLTASCSKDRVRFGSPGIFPSSKSRTPSGAGGGIASIPLLSK